MRRVLALFVLLAGTARADPTLDERLAALLPPAPSPDEIAWQPTLAAGRAVAHEEERPILLWAMNGHPLGCT